MLRILMCTAIVALLASAQSPQTRPQPVDGTPLLRAKLALEMARSRALEDRYTDVSSALRDASKALRDYENLSPGPHAETAAYMRQVIDSFARRASRDRDDAVDRIQMWLGVVNQWYTATLK
jgi:hypothetical protein